MCLGCVCRSFSATSLISSDLVELENEELILGQEIDSMSQAASSREAWTSEVSWPTDTISKPFCRILWLTFDIGLCFEDSCILDFLVFTMSRMELWTVSSPSCPQELWSLLRHCCLRVVTFGMWQLLAHGVSLRFKSSPYLGSSSFKVKVEKMPVLMFPCREKIQFDPYDSCLDPKLSVTLVI